MEQAATRDPLIGVTVGNYEVKAKLGEGGMGAVYLAEHPLIGKKVALKVLHSEFSNNQDVAGRFFDEARAVTDIKHPNIVDILDYGVIPQDHEQTVYFIMEYLDGQSLAQLIHNEAPLDPERALAIAFQAADALNASHQRGIVHRDLKPDNVMLVEHGREHDFVKVLDFGIAKLGTAEPGSRRTRVGVILGTPQYMAPEQCDGSGQIDHRADIYALGVLLYEMLTRRLPFEGNTFQQVVMQKLTQIPPRPSSLTQLIPPHVEAVILKALETNPDGRFPSMDEFMKALADPVGFVEHHGGVQAFVGTPILPAAVGAPRSVSSVSNPPTSAPGQMFTPGAGQVPVYTPPSMPSSHGAHGTAPGVAPHAAARVAPHATPSAPPHTAPGVAPGTATGVGEPSGSATRIGIIAAVVMFILAGTAGAYFVLSPGGKSEVTETPTDEGVVDDGLAGDPGDPTTDTTTDTTDTPITQDDSTAGDDPRDDAAAMDPAGTGADGPAADGPGDADDTTPPPLPRPAMVSINVISNPPGASVYVGGESQPRGLTPCEFELEKANATYELVLELDGYKTYKRRFTPRNNKEFDLRLKKDRTRKPRDDRKDRDANKSGGDKDRDKSGGRDKSGDKNRDKDRDKPDDSPDDDGKSKYDEDVGLVPLEG